MVFCDGFDDEAQASAKLSQLIGDSEDCEEGVGMLSTKAGMNFLDQRTRLGPAEELFKDPTLLGGCIPFPRKLKQGKGKGAAAASEASGSEASGSDSDGDDERAMDKKMKAAELTLLENIGNMPTKAPAAVAAADACVRPRVSLGRARDLKNAAAEMSSDEDKEKFIVLAKTLIRSAAAAVEGSL